ncbi:hypothetical protein Q6348_14455 [Isoptericola sp. b441]|uniref:Uncharacterized protein n=1 Tax=Actinotalea lenta TaxID=3064654 RepID=A0ABT9DBY6_9CELL|nr:MULTISPECIES: hypothetical protein [unclassified Isoptericola]MDO8108397.1 hypothetical protein [Isoptericola sp. b441]MDO8119816.1 hypothetical protein [Isoptericola sp. b490]
MTGTAKLLTNLAFAMMVLFGVIGGLFIAGYAFEDLSTWAAIGSTAAWLVPTVLLCLLSFSAHPAVPTVFVVLSGLVATFTVLDATTHLVDRDAIGPVAAIGVFALAVSLAFLGRRRMSLAGILLVGLGVVQLVATGVGFVDEWRGGGGPGLGDLLTTSSGVIVVPMLLVGALFLVAGGLAHQSGRFWHLPPAARPAH